MPSNVHSFNANVRRRTRGMPEELVEKRHRAISLEALRGVVLMTPVDTGRARGNWQVTHDEPATGVLKNRTPAGTATIERGAAVIRQAKAFSITWIVNNLPYAQRLEDGYSKQAPAGMLAVTMARLRSLLAR